MFRRHILRVLACSLLPVAQPLAAFAQSAAPEFVPPAKAAAPALPPAALAPYLQRERPVHIFSGLKNLAASPEGGKDGQPNQVAEGIPVDLDAAVLFGKPFADGAGFAAVAEIESEGAAALRLQFDLTALGTEDELWLIDPATPHAFGPFTAGAESSSAFWSPTVFGSTVVVLLRATTAELPPIRLLNLSHFFTDPLPKASTTCPEEVACQTDPEIQEMSTGVGRLLVTDNLGGTLGCSGSLLANPSTTEVEPLFLTANHCFPSIGVPQSLEVIWDYRAAACDGAGVPASNLLPRSFGGTILAASRTIDIELLRLNSVPAGALGRAYFGWDVREPSIGDRTVGMHHPAGAPMKICFGAVTRLGVSTPAGVNQTRVLWSDGITEGGSSGSGLLFEDDLVLFGVLSNGEVHSCVNRDNNFDNYSSFRDFFPQIACHFTDGSECEEGGGCPAKASFGADSDQVASLRNFRDKLLAKSAAGQKLIDIYYTTAPTLATLVSHSKEARALFVAAATPVAVLGERLP